MLRSDRGHPPAQPGHASGRLHRYLSLKAITLISGKKKTKKWYKVAQIYGTKFGCVEELELCDVPSPEQ